MRPLVAFYLASSPGLVPAILRHVLQTGSRLVNSVTGFKALHCVQFFIWLHVVLSSLLGLLT